MLNKKHSSQNSDELLQYINSYLKNTKFKKLPNIDPFSYGHGPWNWMRNYTTASDNFIKRKNRNEILAISGRFWDQYLNLKKQYTQDEKKLRELNEEERSPRPATQYSLFAGRVNSMEKVSFVDLSIELSSDFAKVANDLDSVGLIKSAQQMRDNRQKLLVRDSLTKDVVQSFLQNIKVIEGKIKILHTLVTGGSWGSEDIETAKAELGTAIEKVNSLHKKMYEVYNNSFSNQ